MKIESGQDEFKGWTLIQSDSYLYKNRKRDQDTERRNMRSRHTRRVKGSDHGSVYINQRTPENAATTRNFQKA